MGHNKIIRKKREYYPEDLVLNTWDTVENSFAGFTVREVESEDDFKDFIRRYGEFMRILEEEYAWKYIDMTCHADNPEKSEAYKKFHAEILAPSEKLSFQVKKKILGLSESLKITGNTYQLMAKILKKDIKIFREENISLFVQENELTTAYAELMSSLTVTFQGKERTLPAMAPFYRSPDRSVRQEAWNLVLQRTLQEKDRLSGLFGNLYELRKKISENSGFTDYRDYMHTAKGRFDYSPDDLFRLHETVKKTVVPVVKELNQKKAMRLGLKNLRPWDASADPDGIELRPFKSDTDLIEGVSGILQKIDPLFRNNLEKMHRSGFLDLGNRKGKAPGGYNFPLAEHGAAFIFMNSVGMHRDVSTLLHESGHAQHSFAMASIQNPLYREVPMEAAELASMSMELFGLPFLDQFYSDPAHLKKACRDQLAGTIEFLPWGIIIDRFQQIIYAQENNTEKAFEIFGSLMSDFNTGIDYSGFEKEQASLWLRQLHIFEVPFYYIEYVFSQLGALALYRNYKINPERTVHLYKDFLQLGYTVPLRELYETAGIEFDFSEDYVGKLMEFTMKELQDLE